MTSVPIGLATRSTNNAKDEEPLRGGVVVLVDER